MRNTRKAPRPDGLDCLASASDCDCVASLTSPNEFPPRQKMSYAVGQDFAGSGAKPGLEVWRIEKMTPVKVDEKMHTCSTTKS